MTVFNLKAVSVQTAIFTACSKLILSGRRGIPSSPGVDYKTSISAKVFLEVSVTEQKYIFPGRVSKE